MSELITGKEAYFAIGEGKVVQKSFAPIETGIFGEWGDLDPSAFNIYGMLRDSGNDPQFKFRLKPRTIPLNGIEVPAPFDSSLKHKQYAYVLNAASPDGYSSMKFYEGGNQPLICWTDEEEIKQVVAALRSVFKPR